MGIRHDSFEDSQERVNSGRKVSLSLCRHSEPLRGVVNDNDTVPWWLVCLQVLAARRSTQLLRLSAAAAANKTILGGVTMPKQRLRPAIYKVSFYYLPIVIATARYLFSVACVFSMFLRWQWLQLSLRNVEDRSWDDIGIMLSNLPRGSKTVFAVSSTSC